MIREAIQKLSDENVDKYITKNWKGKAKTFLYDLEASMLLAKHVDVVISPDKKYMHIPGVLKANKRMKIKTVIDGSTLIEVE